MLLVREVPVETIFTRKQQADEREKDGGAGHCAFSAGIRAAGMGLSIVNVIDIYCTILYD